MTPDPLVDHYLRSTGLHAVVALASAGDSKFRIGVGLTRLPAGITAAAAWWLEDQAIAVRLVEVCYQLAALNGVACTRRWLSAPAREADGLLQAGMARLGVQATPDKAMRARARAAIEAIEAELDQRRRTGDLRSVNRDYSEKRAQASAGGERMPSYGDWMLALKRRMVGEAAGRTSPHQIVERDPQRSRDLPERV